MWHKAAWTGHPVRIELTREGLRAELDNHVIKLYRLRLCDLKILNFDKDECTAVQFV